MATNTTDAGLTRREFDGLSALHHALISLLGAEFSVLSMGMSNDLEQALAAGSNMVRIGTAIFGERT